MIVVPRSMRGRRETMLRRFFVLSASLLACAALSATAGAAPANSPRADVIPATCGSEQVEFIVIGNGTFSPGHVAGTTSVFVPYSLDITVTFTPEGGGEPFVESEHSTKPAPATDLVTCNINFSATFPGEGTVSFVGTVTGFFTPR
jgi:hypothetical protein